MTGFQEVRSPAQVAEVARLAREIWRDHYVPIIGQNQVEYMLEKFQSEKAVAEQLARAYEYFVITHDGQSAGYVAIVPNVTEASLQISKIYVRKSERGNGLGKKALEFVEKLCREREIKLIWLTVNKDNVNSMAWYSAMGFRNAGPLVLDIGGGFVMDDFRFEKTVTKVSRNTDLRSTG
jgi:GNAT superfamily N-acetyltransferase